MALTRQNEFDTGTTLTEEELEGEFDYIYSNGTDVAFPLTKSVSAGGFRIDDFSKGSLTTPGINFTGDTNTGIHSSAADVMELAAGGNEVVQLTGGTSDVTYVDIDSGTTGNPPIIRGEGEANTGLTVTTTGQGDLVLSTASTGNVYIQGNSTTMMTVASNTSVSMGTNIPFVPAAVSGTPAQHALFRENVVKGWASVLSTGTTYSLSDSYNVASVTDGAAGIFTVTWDRDFANDTYATAGATTGAGMWVNMGTRAAGSTVFNVFDYNGAAQEQTATVIAIGDQ